jgi:hypothetical protein
MSFNEAELADIRDLLERQRQAHVNGRLGPTRISWLIRMAVELEAEVRRLRGQVAALTGPFDESADDDNCEFLT